MYRLDRNYCKPQTFKEADDNRAYWLSKPIFERLQALNFLNGQVYGFSLDAPPRMDRLPKNESDEMKSYGSTKTSKISLLH